MFGRIFAYLCLWFSYRPKHFQATNIATILVKSMTFWAENKNSVPRRPYTVTIRLRILTESGFQAKYPNFTYKQKSLLSIFSILSQLKTWGKLENWYVNSYLYVWEVTWANLKIPGSIAQKLQGVVRTNNFDLLKRFQWHRTLKFDGIRTNGSKAKFWFSKLLPMWLPFSEGSVAEKTQTIRSENSPSAFIRTKPSRFHRPTQCNGSWLLSRMVVYLSNILGRAHVCAFLVHKSICSLRFSSPCFLVQCCQDETKSRIRYNCALSLFCPFKTLFRVQTQSVQQ